MSIKRYISISALTRYIKKSIDSDPVLQDVWVRGEISNFKHHSRGHMYLTLKDQNSRVQAVMFAGYNQWLSFKPENGMKVLIRGEISVYEAYGSYQLYIKEMQQDGIGNLYLAFEALKKKLDEEGLFKQEIKKSLPSYPREIGVITSPTGAAIRDIFTTIKRRYPAARITVFPVLVQGEKAAPTISNAINQANQLGFIDVLIVGRGGGSIEELWAFNEEVVARTIYQSKIPIISAVGHETDFTISDFVADLRAPTPTAAGELAVPHVKELQTRIQDRTERLYQATRKLLTHNKNKLDHLSSSYAFRYPRQLIRQKELDLDRLIEGSRHSLVQKLEKKRDQLSYMNRHLMSNHPKAKADQAKERVFQLTERLKREQRNLMTRKQQQFNHVIQQLNAFSPLNIMERGYSLTYNQKHELVKSVKDFQPGDQLQLRMKDGNLDCQVWGIEEETISSD